MGTIIVNNRGTIEILFLIGPAKSAVFNRIVSLILFARELVRVALYGFSADFL